MAELPAIAFPHSYLRERDLRKILTFFNPLALCQPWFMEPPKWFHLPEYKSCTRLFFPPEDLKPKGDFQGLIKQYKDWIRQYDPGGYSTSLNTAREWPLDESSSWDIRKDIRRSAEKNEDREHDKALKQHIILHLLKEMEENRLEASEVLDILRKSENPLLEALGDDAPLQEIFEKIPLTDNEPYINETRINHITEAWLSLFSHHGKDFKTFVTLNPPIESFIRAIFEEPTHYSDSPKRLVRAKISVPDPTLFVESTPSEVKETYNNPNAGSALAQILSALERQPAESTDEELTELCREVEKSYSSYAFDTKLSISMTSLPPPTDGKVAGKETIGRLLGGKFLVLFTGEGDTSR